MQMPVAILDEERCWEAIQKRDRTEDGRWFVGVITTGIYCRPSCTSRHALRKNVRFYATSQEAERDGLRPCLRCRPLEAAPADAAAEKIWQLCGYIERRFENDSDSRLNLAELSGRAGISRFHLQRTFKAVVGVTPKQYVEALRTGRLKTGL